MSRRAHRAAPWRAAALALAAAWAAAGAAAAQPAGAPITARADRTTLSTDDTLRVTVEVNARSMQLSQLRQPVFDGFAIVSTGSRSELSMINGVPSMILGYDFVLQPVRAGALVVPSFSIDVDGQTHATAPIAVTVTAGSRPTVSPNELAPGAAAPGQRFFVRAAVDKGSVWLGEQLTYTFRFYQAANLGQQPAYGAPPFTGFWQRRESNQRSDRVLVGDRLYLVTELDTYLFPTRAGTLPIPPATLSLVGDLTDARNRLATEPVTIEVKGLPDGAPPEFTGAVGRYALGAAVDTAAVAVDEPVTLVVTLSGEGNLETAPEPVWPALDGWTAYDDGQSTSIEVRDGRIAGQRRWQRVLVPTRAGSATLPPLRYGTFDPLTGRYAVIEAPSIVLTVRDAPGGAAAAPTAPAAPAAAGAPAATAAPPDVARWAAEAPLVEPAVRSVVGRSGDALDGAPAAVVPAAGPARGLWWLAWLGPFAVVAGDAWRRRRADRSAARRGAADARLHAATAAARQGVAAAFAAADAAAAGGGTVQASAQDLGVAAAVAEAVAAVVRAGVGPAADGLAIDALPPVLAAHGIGPDLVARTLAALEAGQAAAWRPPGLAGADAAIAAAAARHAAADADALLAALGAAFARHLAAVARTGDDDRPRGAAAGAALIIATLAVGGGRDGERVWAQPAAPTAFDAAALVAAADARYADDPAAAADAYAEVAAAGALDAARAVRLGNAYVRLGRPGPAMAAYRLAESRAPRLPALRANLAWLRDQLGDGSVTASGWSPAAWAAASRAWLTRGELAALMLLAWWVTVVAAWLAWRTPRAAWRWAAIGGAVALAVSAALLGARLAHGAAARTAIVVGPGAVAVRQGPGDLFADLRTVPEGAEVRYVERRGRWLRLAEASGDDDGAGWVAAAGVVDVPE